MTWVCDIRGADDAMSAWHVALHAGLATFVAGAGVVFLVLAVIAYRRPVEPLAAPAAVERLTPPF